MFSRANHIRFDATKYSHWSTKRLLRMPNEKVNSLGKRNCLIFSIGIFVSLVTFSRESAVHRRCYLPLRSGFAKMMTDEWVAVYEEGTFKGRQKTNF